jgi:HK97 family phage major capsid protein
MKNLKKLLEKRSLLLADMNKLTDAALTAERSMDEAELAEFNKLKEQVSNLNKTIEALEALAAEEPKEAPAEPETEERSLESAEAIETRAFADYIRAAVSGMQSRALTLGENGAIIGKTIAKRIVDAAVNISPILSAAQRFAAKGTVSVPVFVNGISVAYKADFAELVAGNSSFNSIELKPFLLGALTLIDRSLINESDLDLVSFVVNKMAEALAAFMDKAFLTGSTKEGEIKGISTATKIVTAAAATAITADELIDLQELVPDAKRAGAFFVMSAATRTAIRKLKDGQGNYLLQRDATASFGYSLLGAPVFCADGIAGMGAGNAAVVYVNPQGVGLKLTDNAVELQILQEAFAVKHALGIVGWLQGDVEIIDPEACAVLKMAEA